MYRRQIHVEGNKSLTTTANGTDGISVRRRSNEDIKPSANGLYTLLPQRDPSETLFVKCNTRKMLKSGEMNEGFS